MLPRTKIIRSSPFLAHPIFFITITIPKTILKAMEATDTRSKRRDERHLARMREVEIGLPRDGFHAFAILFACQLAFGDKIHIGPIFARRHQTQHRGTIRISVINT